MPSGACGHPSRGVRTAPSSCRAPRVRRTPRRRGAPQRDNPRQHRTAPPGQLATDRLYECYLVQTRSYRRRARRVVDCYGCASPTLLPGDVLAWVATGRLAPTP